jgi:Predicted membrane protein
MKKVMYLLGCIVGFIVVAYIQSLYVNLGVLHTSDYFLSKSYIILSVAALLLLLLSGIYLNFTKFSIVKIYPVVMLIFGLGYMYVFPAMSAPDEIAHFISAYKISNKMLGKQATVKDGHVIIRAQDLWIEDVDGEYTFDKSKSEEEKVLIPEEGSHGKIISSKLEETSYKVFYAEGNIRGADNYISFSGQNYEKAQSLHAPVNTIPSVYFLPATGITVARIMGLNSIYLVLFGRTANLILFILLGTLGIYFLPRFKEFIFLVSLLPTTIELAASYSYDAVMISSMIFFVSYVFYLAHEKKDFDIKDLVIVSLIAGLVLPCKMVYFPMLLLLFSIPLYKFKFRGKVDGKIKKENIAFFLASAVVVLLSWVFAMYLVNRATVVGYSTSTTSSLEWAGEESYTIGYLLHNKLKAVKLFYNTLLLQLEYYHKTMFGAYLGHADDVVGIPYIGFLVLNIGMIFSVFGEAKEKQLLVKERVLTGISIFFVVFLVLLSMLIAWTPISSEFIEGVSGRYFIPVLLPMLMIFRNNKIVIKDETKRNIIFLFILINAISLLKIFSTVCIRL